MNQFISTIYFLPCIISLIWTFIYCFRVKTLTQKMMQALLVLCVFYFTTYACYISPWTDHKVMAWLDRINIPVILLILAIDLIFVWTHHGLRLYQSRTHWLFYLPAVIVASLIFLLTPWVRLDFIVRCAEVLDYIFILIITCSCLKLSRRNGYRVGDVFRFFFRANESNPVRVVCVLNVATLCLLAPIVPQGGVCRSYLLAHPAWGCTLTLLLSITFFCLCYVEYMIDIPRFSLSSLSNVSIGTPEKAEEENLSTAAQSMIRTEEKERVEAALRWAFAEARVYKDPNLSIVGLAAQLKTNRTTLSLIISQVYGMNFRQLVAHHRIEAAKRYMLEKPEAKQEEVALECGFITAQAFNQKFKEIIGESPRQWMSKQGN